MINENATHTLYEWCFINMIRPNSKEFEKNDLIQDDFMTRKIGLEEFKEFMVLGKFKKNSMPRKPEKYLELRMYGFVPYNISDIQKGIQFDHAKDVYKLKYGMEPPFKIFLEEWLTTIILNGGTSNEGHMVRHGFKDEMYTGTMQQHFIDLKDNLIDVAAFYEPDLNSMLSGLCFLVDERVFNKKLYPDFIPSPFPDVDMDGPGHTEVFNKWSRDKDIQYQHWVDKIGGPKNEFLRFFLADKRLA